jgi:Zn-dependent alcohol dehydrogenase
MNKKRISAGMADPVAAANDLTIGNGNKVPVTGNGTVNGINIINWQAGSEIDIVCIDSPTFKHNTAASTGFKSLMLAGSVDLVAAPKVTLCLWYDGTVWQEKTRKIP